jgi:hydroxymethylpyrimidine/phosphomethylpyrimidine kinase
MSGRMPIALTVAGSDPSGGAGIQADLKTFHQFGVYGEAVVAAVTVQNTARVEQVESLSPELVARQIRAVLDDMPPAAAKTGALGSARIVRAVAELARQFTFPLVVDPVMISTHGASLLAEAARRVLRDELLPLASLVTPNLQEAAVLSGLEVSDVDGMRRAAERIAAAGAKAVLVKGGHLAGDPVDILFYGGHWFEFTAARVITRHTHGTGCAYSAAITAGLALGRELPEAVRRARLWITEAIRTGPGLGSGAGPINHFAAVAP